MTVDITGSPMVPFVLKPHFIQRIYIFIYIYLYIYYIYILRAKLNLLKCVFYKKSSLVKTILVFLIELLISPRKSF